MDLVLYFGNQDLLGTDLLETLFTNKTKISKVKLWDIVTVKPKLTPIK